MKMFFDTSAIVKAFHKEIGTENVLRLLKEENAKIFLSELTIIEYKSALYRRYNNKQITEENLRNAFKAFDEFLKFVNMLPLNSFTIKEAEVLFSKYYQHGLRTLDALQLAAFTSMYDYKLFFVTADTKLYQIVKLANFKTINPVRK